MDYTCSHGFEYGMCRHNCRPPTFTPGPWRWEDRYTDHTANRIARLLVSDAPGREKLRERGPMALQARLDGDLHRHARRVPGVPRRSRSGRRGGVIMRTIALLALLAFPILTSAAPSLRPVTTDSIRRILGEPVAQHTTAGRVTWEFRDRERPGYTLRVVFDARSHRMLRYAGGRP